VSPAPDAGRPDAGQPDAGPPEVAAGGEPEPVELDTDAWDPWRPAQLAARLAGIGLPWWVCAGWSLDLWRGRQTREHADIEFAICRADLPAFQARFADHELYYVGLGPGRAVPLAPGRLPPADYFQVWVREPDTGLFRTDIFLDPGDHETWVCKRDHGVRRPLAEAVGRTPAGIPYLRPEVTLLMKAKGRRDKDEADLAAALPALPAAARTWLAGALERVHPGHPWLATVRPEAE
jgi:hypothetical protein